MSYLVTQGRHDIGVRMALGAQRSRILAASALLASYVPARRATRVDPVVALRED